MAFVSTWKSSDEIPSGAAHMAVEQQNRLGSSGLEYWRGAFPSEKTSIQTNTVSTEASDSVDGKIFTLASDGVAASGQVFTG